MVKLFKTMSDTTCTVKVYRLASDWYKVDETTTPYTCAEMARSFGYTPSKSSRPALLRSAAPAQSGPFSAGYLWILSDTPPSTAPVTDDAVFAVDPNTFQTVATILTPGPIPQAIAAGNTGNWVYVTIQGVPDGENGIPAHPPLIEVINTSTLAIAQTINLPQNATPGRVSSSPDDRYVYVPDTSEGQLLVVDTQNPSSIVTIPLTETTRYGQSAASAVGNSVITPDGELVFVLCGVGFCTVDTTTRQQVSYVGYGAGLETLSDLAIDPTGSRLYLAGQTYVYAYDTGSLMQTGSVLTKQGVQLNGIGIISDGSLVVANDQNSTAVFSIDPMTLAVKEEDLAAPAPFPSGESPTSIMVVQ